MENPIPPAAEESPISTEEEIAYPPTGGLSFADGLQFGCGFMVAVILSFVILALAVLAIVLILSLFGISIL